METRPRRTGGEAGDEDTPRSVLVGRDEELARLVATVSRPPSVAVIEGEAGIGKPGWSPS